MTSNYQNLLLFAFQPFGLFLPIYIAGLYTVIWRRTLPRPWIFLALGVVVIGAAWALIYRLMHSTDPPAPLPGLYQIDPGHVPEQGSHHPPSASEAFFESLWENRTEITLVAASYPLLLLLRRVMK
jgi:hypothetical protein